MNPKIEDAYQMTIEANKSLTNEALSEDVVLDRKSTVNYCFVIQKNLRAFIDNYVDNPGFDGFLSDLYCEAATLVNRVKTKFEEQVGAWDFRLAPREFLNARKLK